MEFGIQYFPIDSRSRTAAQYFEESLLLAVQAEQLGFTHARIVEHYFESYGGLTPNPLVFLSAAAQRTKLMRLVTGALLPVFNNPLKMAGEIGMVDAISNGRLDVGFARAFLPHEFRRFKISPDESRARFEEGLTQIDLLLRGTNVSHDGLFHSFENVTSLPRPTQTPRPKFYIAATQTAETFEYAGANGFSLMAIPIGPIKPLIEVYREAWQKSGFPGNGEVMIAFHMFCDHDRAKARTLARGPFDLYFSSLSACASEWSQGTSSGDYKNYDKSMKALQQTTLEKQVEGGGAWIGDPIEITEQIERAIEIIGPFEHASLQVNFGDIDFPAASKSLSIFCEKVLPKFTIREDSFVN